MVDAVRNGSNVGAQGTGQDASTQPTSAQKNKFSGALAAAVSRAAKPVYDAGGDGDDPDPAPIPMSAPVMLPSKDKKAQAPAAAAAGPKTT